MSCSPSAAILGSPAPLAPAQAGELTTLAAPFYCVALSCVLRAGCCVVRQAVSRAQRTHQGSRGQASDYPSCTERCAQGRGVREAVGGDVTWRGSGPGGRFDGGRRGGMLAMLAGRERLRLVGLLDPVPTCDAAPQPVEPPEPDDVEGAGLPL